MSSGQKIQLIDTKFEEIKNAIISESLTKDLLEKNFSSIKNYLKQNNIQFFQFMLKRKIKKLELKKEHLNQIKIMIDNSLKQELDIVKTIRELKNVNRFKELLELI